MKVMLFANTDWYLYNFRRQLAEALRARGDDVVLVSPPGEYAARLQALGFCWIAFPLSRRGMHPLGELASIIKLTQLYQRERPELIHHFTIKCVLYGSLAARLAGVRGVVNSITGLGYVFMGSGWLKQALLLLVRVWYRLILRGTQVIFENADDRAAFVALKLIGVEAAHQTPGVGVDLDRFHPQPEAAERPVALLPARLLWDKGVGEFVAAARQLKSESMPARFALTGRVDAGNPTSIPEAQLAEWQAEGVVEWWGWSEDMPAVLTQASVICLPSYREGLPTVLIEAAACGRAIVTTDVPGCRATVRVNETGLLVPVKDAEALADALRKLLTDAALRAQMGVAARRFAEEIFAAPKVIDQILQIYARALI